MTTMEKTTKKQCPTGRKTRIFIRCVIVLSCVYILADPIDRYFQEGVLGLVGYKSYLYSAQDLFFALCAVVGLSNLARYPLLGWSLANIAAAGFLLFPIYCLIAGVMFRSNILDLSCIMPVVFFVLLFVINQKECRPKRWYVYLPLIFLLILGEIPCVVYAARNFLLIG